MSAEPGSAHPRPASIGLMQVVAAARETVAFFTELSVDQVASCAAAEDGWRVVVDVVESRARVGDNDLLAAYEVRLDATATVTRIERLGRYHREDREGVR